MFHLKYSVLLKEPVVNPSVIHGGRQNVGASEEKNESFHGSSRLWESVLNLKVKENILVMTEIKIRIQVSSLLILSPTKFFNSIKDKNPKFVFSGAYSDTCKYLISKPSFYEVT